MECSLYVDSTTSGHACEPHSLAKIPKGSASLPSLVNKGIGKQLLKEFEKYAKNEEVSLIKLRVLKENKKATKFYLSNGWLKKAISIGEYDLFEKNIVCD